MSTSTCSKFYAIATALALTTTTVCAATITTKSGWQLFGTDATIIDVSSVFNDSNVTAIWAFDYNTTSWKVYTPNATAMAAVTGGQVTGVAPLNSLSANQGFWLNGAGESVITLPMP